MTEKTSCSLPMWTMSKPFLWTIFVIATIATLVLFDRLGISDYCLPAFLSVVALSTAVWINWALHVKVWFWVSVFNFVVLHILLTLWIGKHAPWKGTIGGASRGLAAIVLADAAIMTAVIRFPDWLTSSYEWFFGEKTERTAGR